MKFEHVGINVPDAAAMAAWYVEHCGMTILRKLDAPPHTHFLADDAGNVVMEIYTNDAAPVPDYANQHTLVYHLALSVGADIQEQIDRLLAAGATPAADDRLPDGSRVTTLRDPWGAPLQLAYRATPLG
jgi:catechol 2,3-dioxygenase-like lactoylglutathione lyase family enzyme